MVVLELTEDEASRLHTGLNRLLIELDREIARTDSKEYRRDLEQTEQVIRDVWGQLKRVA